MCQCPLGLIPHFYIEDKHLYALINLGVNALSGLYLISTTYYSRLREKGVRCQCPLGLIPHFYSDSPLNYTAFRDVVSMPSRAYTSFLLYKDLELGYFGHVCVNALSGLYLISTVPLQKPRFYAVSRACFCRYLSEYSDNSRFSCMLTFWTYLMRCTYP